MKIFTAEQIKQADDYTIKNEPVSSDVLMERAASKISAKLIERYNSTQKIAVVVGSGNNGGDGLVIVRHLVTKGFSVDVYDANVSSNYSPDFVKNYQRLKAMGIVVQPFKDGTSFDNYDMIVDAILGSGLNRPVRGHIADVIDHINLSNAEIIAVDIPSGLFAEDNTDNNGAIVEADITYSFQFPKLSFLFPENEHFVGNFEVLDIGIHPDYIAQTDSPYHYTQKEDIRFDLLKRSKFAHKGTFGHALLFTGSEDKMGASILSAKACIRSGAGLVTALLPKNKANMMPLTVPEVMTESYTDKPIKAIDIDKYTVIGAGCGIGTSDVSKTILHQLLKASKNPMVLDADAINILVSDRDLIPLIPKHSILTPHLKELERLIGQCENHYDRINKTLDFARQYHLYLVIKLNF